MFKNENCENELIQNMSLNLQKSSNNDNLIKEIDKLNQAAQIFENIGIKSASDKILEVLASLK